MLWLLLAMVLILVVAGGVVLYVAYPHRGEQVPGAPWLGEAMKQAVEAVPVLDSEVDRLPPIPSQEVRRRLHPDEQRESTTA